MRFRAKRDDFHGGFALVAPEGKCPCPEWHNGICHTTFDNNCSFCWDRRGLIVECGYKGGEVG